MRQLILYMILVLYFSAISQNYIYNPGFETADGGNTSFPSGVAQADKMTSWETRTQNVGTIDLHSPDWINSNGTGVQTIKGVHPGAHTHDGMIGITNYELIQQEFNNQSMDGETFHDVSMWVYMPSTESKNCRLKIMLSKNRLKYDDESIIPWEQNSADLCTKKYTEFSNLLSSWTTIHEFDFNNLNLPYDSWQKISFTFKTPSNLIMQGYDFFAMELRKNGYDPDNFVTPCEDSYIFIDDISLVKSSFCNAACAPNLGSITHTTFSNVMVTNYAWGFYVNNAIGIEFTLYDRWGIAAISTETAFDPNGLIDVGYTNYAFGWNALNNNGQLFPEDTYPYILKIYNCNQTINYVGNIFIISNGYPSIGYNIHNYELNDCCPNNDRYIQNVTYISDYIETSKKNIFAGYNVTTSVANGNVIVNSGVEVKYVAKNISLQSGFSVMPGGSFKAIQTEDCIYQSVRRMSIRERPNIDGYNSLKINNEENHDILISPNPSNGIFTLKVLNSELLTIEIYNYYGSKILSYNKENFNSLINLENEANGTYFYKIILSDGKVSSGKLIKTN